jgi:DNA-binding CsgD family transcriptional regulator
VAYAPVGRDNEREALIARLAASGRGEGSLVVIEGEGGTGKSTLVAGLADAARTAEHHVLHARAWELSASVPYETLVAAVSRHLRSRQPDEVARLTTGLPTLGSLIEGLDLAPKAGAPEAFKVRAQEAFATLIARLAAERPVVLSLDDLHWADQASLEVLQYVCLDLPDASLLVVVTLRPDETERRAELRQLVASLRRAPWASTIRLGRLDDRAIDAMVAARLGGDVTPRIRELVASRSGGTPLLVQELLDDLVERDVIVFDGRVWRLVGEPPPPTRSASDLIRARLDRVEPHDRAVLEALAVVNAPTDPAIVAALLSIEPDEVERALQRLRANRLAVETEGDPSGTAEAVWTVEHPVVAEVVESEMVDAARRRLHRRLLDVDTHAPLGRRARHALVGGDPTDRVATIDLLAAAGTEALRRATPAAAIEPLRGALALLGSGNGDGSEVDAAIRHRVERDLGIAYLLQLEIQPAATHLRRAWERAREAGDPAACVELLHALDNAEFRAGNGGVNAAALDWLRSEAAAREAWDLLIELAWVHLSHAGRDRSSAELDRAAVAFELIPPVAMPRRGHALGEVMEAYRQIGATDRSAGERVDHFLAAAERWNEFPDVAHRCVLLAYDAAMLAGDPRLLARCHAARQRLQELTGEPTTWRVPLVEALRGIAEGRLDERPADLQLHGARVRSDVLKAIIAALATRYVEGPSAARALLEEELPAVPAGGGSATDLQATFGRLRVSLGTDAEQAAAEAAVAEMRSDPGLAAVSGFLFGGLALVAMGIAGDEQQTAEAIAGLDRLGAGRWMPSAWAAMLRARACAAPGDGAHELLHAADVLAGLGRELEAAERVIDAAEADADAVPADRLAAAYDAARRAGAAWLTGRVEALAPPGRTRNWVRAADGALTGREMEVAELVAAGLTNREIAGRLYISIRTVTSHLDHIYTKLGLSSRDELSDWYRSQA